MGTTRRRRTTHREQESVKNGVASLAVAATKSTIPSFENVIAENDIDVAQTAWDVIRHHPLFWASILLGFPYILFVGWRWIVLQHPFLPGMRPAVGMNDTRQLLIIGSMSSGTSSIAQALRQDVGIEVVHEDSDTLWTFVRDGTVSWFHGIRYWNHPGNRRDRKSVV